MTAEERSLLLTVAGAVSGLLDGLFSDAVFRELTGQELSNAILERMKAVPFPAPLTPRAKHVSIEHAPRPGTAAKRWEHARKKADGITWVDPERDPAIYRSLLFLGEDGSHADVAAIVGASWAYLSCDGCDENALVRAVRIEGQYGDGHRYCPTCIREAAALLDTMV